MMRNLRRAWLAALLAASVTPPLGGVAFGFDTITWSTVASAPVGRTEAQGILVDGKLYLLGGFQGSPFGPTDSAYAYDPATNGWTTLAPMPMRLTHAGVAAVDGDIYVAGGYFGSSSTNFGAQTFATTAVWRYRIATNVWSAMPSLPQARGSGGLAARGRFLHFYGGADISRVDKGEHWILNLDSGGWVAAAAMPNPRSHMGYAELGGKVYAIGGQHNVDAALVTQPSVHVFDPATGAWTELAPMPVARGHISAATFPVGARILVLGGETSHGSSVNHVTAYDPFANTWTALTPLPANRYSGVAGVLGGTLFYTTGNGSTTTYKGIAVGFTGLPDVALSPASVVINDVQGGAASAARTVTIANLGEGPLAVTGILLGGSAADQWQITSAPALPASIPAGGTAIVNVAFAPTSTGPKIASLDVANDDADTPVASVALRGLGTLGTGGSNEPSLQWILDTWGIPVTVGDPDPTNNSLPTTPLLGEEVSLQSFRKAGAGSVTLEPLAVFGPTSGSGIVARVGWYGSGNAASKQELFTVPNASSQTLTPTTTGTLAFDPGSAAFGFYSIWPFFSNREVFGEDALNTFSGAIPHHVRVYPLKDAGGAVVPNAYVVATEETTSGFDYQDVVYVARNVRPAGSGCTTAADCSGTPPECTQFACIANECQAVPGSAGTPCSGDGNPCTSDVCNGSGSCTHPAGNAGVECRPSAGDCDAPEACTGLSATCPSDIFVNGGVCRPMAGPCDVAESCSGSSPACPADGFVVVGTPCRSAAGPCDLVEACTGLGPLCPADGFAAGGTPCRAAAGLCDVPETCSGGAAGCPADVLVPSGTSCRASLGECDPAEACDGANPACPADQTLASGTPCTSDANACTTDACDGSGGCGHVTPPGLCDDADACTNDTCNAATGCAHAPLGGQACNTGEPGACAAGMSHCDAGTVTCERTTDPTSEQCGDGIDDDCDGEIDDADVCSPQCTTGNTTASDVQTKATKATLKEIADRDKIATQGTFVVPAGTFDPVAHDVVLVVRDGSGNVYYTGTLPAGSFVTKNGRSFKFKDKFAPFENGGLRDAQFAVKADGATVKYKFAGQALNLPAFAPGVGAVSVMVGDRCWADMGDLCTTSAGGAKCK